MMGAVLKSILVFGGSSFLSVMAAPFNPFANLANDDHKGWDLNCIAINVYHEARGENFEGQVGLAYVLKNRVENKRRWGKDYCKAVYSKKQWSWTVDGRPDAIKSKFHYGNALFVARLVYENRVDDPTNGADHVYSGKKAPWWAKQMQVTAKLGNQVFLKE